ncbi:hypothetical protein D5687_04715 [Guyparkeria sp. SCN-R1]|uniref:hypothetical protein n=1 Tax=Guyparkeria sp. SCN-R1 TaxID=2341113 RepID=UPI000F64802D|nr:hypothetical protein [Guyparkeria sp. SCN-R1]RRQ24040.1 hypothetical protein D5687_04715 [Guyparkeria sp. SCN-R1]
MTDVSSQVAAAHLELIEAVSSALTLPEATPTAGTAAMLAIDQYREDGWNALAEALKRRLAGRTVDESTLDDEDRMILAAIDRATDEPRWLHRVAEQAEVEAAEQIAALILAATWGERDALAALNEMREAARAAGIQGSTAHAFVAIVEGERRLDALIESHENAQAGLVERTLVALTQREQGQG